MQFPLTRLRAECYTICAGFSVSDIDLYINESGSAATHRNCMRILDPKPFVLPAVLYLFAVAVAFLFFAPSLHNFFTYDDFRYLENLFHGPRQVLLGYNMIRVVSNLIWVPLYGISGFDPVGYNVFNLFIFSLNPLLLFFFLRQFTGRTDFAAVGSVVFACSGVACDAFFWKMSLSTLTQASFYLATLTAYLRFRTSGSRRSYFLSLSLFLLGMFTKEDAASLPLMILLLEGLFFGGLEKGRRTGASKTMLPYAGIVLLYLVTSFLVFHLLEIPSETAKFFQVQPLYSLFAGYTLFFIDPTGILSMSSPAMYVTVAVLVAGTFLIRDHRRLYLFGLLWIVVAFLPPSLSSVVQFQPKYLLNSISRLLYLPSIGGAIVVAAAMCEVRSRFSLRAFIVTSTVFVALLLYVNVGRVHSRGTEWRDEAAPVRVFLEEMKRVVPRFPPQSRVVVLEPPVGRAYVQQAMRAWYQTPDITWMHNVDEFRANQGEMGFLISCDWLDDEKVKLEVYDFSTQTLVARSR